MKKLIMLILLITPLILAAQKGSAGSKAYYESRYIVDMPNAGVMPKGSFSIFAVAYNGGGILAEITAAPFKDFNMGISYSGLNIIGEGEVTFQDLPGIHMKYRFIDESKSIPAFVLGVNIQGRDKYYEDLNRFRTMSPGIYMALSKQFLWTLGPVSFHAGVNYSFEPPSDDRAANFYIGFEQGLGNAVSFDFEYNSNTDDKNKTIMKNSGLLNAALRLSLPDGFTVGLQARDLLENYSESHGFTRCLTLEYVNNF